jgi:hypothetical protein
MKINLAPSSFTGLPQTLGLRSSAFRVNALMRFLFQSGDDLVETLKVGGVDLTNNSTFQCG